MEVHGIRPWTPSPRAARRRASCHLCQRDRESFAVLAGADTIVEMGQRDRLCSFKVARRAVPKCDDRWRSTAGLGNGVAFAPRKSPGVTLSVGVPREARANVRASDPVIE